MRLSIPWNHDPDLLSALDPWHEYFDNLYLPFHASVAMAGRAFRGASSPESYMEEIRLICTFLTKWNKGITMLLNVPFFPVNLKAVVAATLMIADMAPRVRIKFVDAQIASQVASEVKDVIIGVSAIANVTNWRQASYWKQTAGAQYVTAAREVSRNLAALRDIKSAGVDVAVILYDKCIPWCPYLSHHTEIRNMDGRENAFTFHLREICSPFAEELRRTQPWVLAVKEILPGHLKYLKGIVDEVKLAGRSHPTERIIRDIILYLEGKSLAHPSGLYHEPEEAWEKISKCHRNCNECNWCRDNIVTE
jgi:collagenase-like PrtC family protease